MGDPTRNDHIFDLVLTTQPEMLKDVSIVPGMSDHEAITFSLSHSSSQVSKPAHKVYLFHKGNIEAIKEEITSFQESFINSDPYNKSVEENWLLFKSFILQAIHSHIPQKSVKQRKNLP